MKTVEELIEALLAQSENTLKASDIESMLENKLAEAALRTETAITEAVQKAMPQVDREGVGRKGVITDEREEDPYTYIVQKSRKPTEMSTEDKQLAWGIMDAALRQGMKD